MIARRSTMLIAGLCWCGSAFSHHSPASHYVMEESITVTGVVGEFRLINPHARIYFDVTNEAGEVEHWLAEGNAAAVLKRRGWAANTLEPGDVIEISGNPARDGSHKLDWKRIVSEDGTELFGGNTVAEERERQIEALENRPRRDR